MNRYSGNKGKKEMEEKQVTKSIDKETLIKIKTLAARYNIIWKKEVNFSIIPADMTVERCIKTLELMLMTGESLLVSYNRLYRPYCYMTRIHQ